MKSQVILMADRANGTLRDVPSQKKYVCVPKNDAHWVPIAEYMEEFPDADYAQAPDSAREAFLDMKYGLRIHWGIYTQLNLLGESWAFLNLSDGERQEYQQAYKQFDPVRFDADEWMDFFVRAGFKCFAITTKHHDGFSLFKTNTRVKRRVNWTAPVGPAIENCDLAYSVGDAPFGRDIIKELCDAARNAGLKINLYFSHPDWYDADFRPHCYHPFQTPDYKKYVTSGEDVRPYNKGREVAYGPPLEDFEFEAMNRRHREQLIELVSDYGKIDMLCLDMWLGEKAWPETKKTIKQIRKIQPDIMMRARGIGNYGDYYTPEGFVPGDKENTEMPWMALNLIANTSAYDPEAANYKDAGWIIRNMLDAVSKGGNYMIGAGPDKTGLWHPEAIKRLTEVGDWLKRNGEAIYATRPREGDAYREGENVYYTRSKDGKIVYAIHAGEVAGNLTLLKIDANKVKSVESLKNGEPAKFAGGERGGLTISVPVEKTKGEVASAFKISYK
ncbi:MAG: alpha-L-fucosidase [Defluviitaleaceae bacterium]|nr:alpha-L-fucosidase [Defluviitaleaceae bacterium]